MSIKPGPWKGLLQGLYLKEIASDLAFFARGKRYEWVQSKNLILLQTPQKSYFIDLDPYIASCIPTQSHLQAPLSPLKNWPGPHRGIIEEVYTQKNNALVLLTQKEPTLKGWVIRLAARIPNIIWINESAHPLHESAFNFSLEFLEKVEPKALKTDIETLWHQRQEMLDRWRKQEAITTHFEKELHLIDTRLEKLKRSKTRAPDPLFVKKEASLLQAYGNSFTQETDSLVVWDWLEEKECLIHKPENDIHSYIKGLFHKAKGFEKHLEILSHQIHALEEKRETLQKSWKQCEKTLSLPKEVLPKAKASCSNNPLLKGIRVFESCGALFLVGKSSEDNMKLSFRIASGNDLWLHVQDYPGSHVIVKKTQSDTRLDSEQILEIGALLAHHFSSARAMSEVDVSWTWSKWVKKIPGAKSGTVALQESHRYHCRQNPTLLAQLFATLSKES